MKRGKFTRIAISLLVGCILPQAAHASTPPNEAVATLPTPLPALIIDETLAQRERTHWRDTISQMLSRVFPEMRILEGGSDDDALVTLLEHSFDNSKNETRSSTRRIEILLINSDQTNAFASPADKVTGSPARIRLTYPLLLQLRSESELAFVIAHELAHIRHNHFSLRFPTSMLTPSQMSHIRSVHEGWELDADRQAVSQLSNAGFDPAASVSILTRLRDKESPRSEHCLHGHPLMIERLNSLEDELSRLPSPTAPFPG